MPFIPLTRDGQIVRRRRIFINGAPNTWKTSACLTAPKPIGILSYPGEKGYDTIPLDNPEIIPLIWRDEDSKRLDSSQIVSMVGKAAIELITGKYGHINTFVGDGLHKYIGYLLDDVTDGAWFAGAEFEPKLYALAYRRFEDHISRVTDSQIPVAIFTSWDGDTPDRKKKGGEKSSDVPTSIRPNLPGQLAKQVLGEFSVVFHQSLKIPKPGEEAIGVWQTRADNLIAGASIKAPASITTRIPKFIKADYPTFETLWSKAEEESKT